MGKEEGTESLVLSDEKPKAVAFDRIIFGRKLLIIWLYASYTVIAVVFMLCI